MGTSFGFNRQEADADYLSADDLVHLLVDVVARGGNLLLNVGPAADGSVPWVQARRLLALGWWLRTNGPAIYGSAPWERPEAMTADGVPVRFTVAGDALHVILLGTPQSDVVELAGVPAAEGARVDLLGFEAPLIWERAGDGVRVTLPTIPAASPAPVLRVSPRPG
jgi:alpha-L-fucosidase